MYGNYSHFVKFPAGFGGECGASARPGGDAGTAKGTRAESSVYMLVRRARVRVRVQERGQSRVGDSALAPPEGSPGRVCGTRRSRDGPAGSGACLQPALGWV